MNSYIKAPGNNGFEYTSAAAKDRCSVGVGFGTAIFSRGKVMQGVCFNAVSLGICAFWCWGVCKLVNSRGQSC